MQDKSLYNMNAAGMESVLSTNKVLKNTYMLLAATLAFAALAGGVAMNVKLNMLIADMPEGLLDHTYLAGRAGLIDPAKAMDKAMPGNPPWKEGALRSPDLDPERAGTSHFVAVDRYGNSISMTTCH